MTGEPLTLRRATPEDARLIWTWANDPTVRAQSFRAEPIPWEAHLTWFGRKLADPRCLLWVAADAAGQPVGQIRFDCNDVEAEIGVSIAPEQRGKGYGATIIAVGVDQTARASGVRTFHAFIKVDNVASLRAFQKVGFRDVGPDDTHGAAGRHLTLQIASWKPA